METSRDYVVLNKEIDAPVLFDNSRAFNAFEEGKLNNVKF